MLGSGEPVQSNLDLVANAAAEHLNRNKRRCGYISVNSIWHGQSDWPHKVGWIVSQGKESPIVADVFGCTSGLLGAQQKAPVSSE